MKYDLLIIGGGSAAFAAALKATELGWKKVGIIENGPIGSRGVGAPVAANKFPGIRAAL